MYIPPRRSRTEWRNLWRRVHRALLADPRYLACTDAVQRCAEDVLLGLHRSRDYETGLIDAAQKIIAKKAKRGVTTLKEGLANLWAWGYLEVVPRRLFDPNSRPPGWRGRGRW